MAEDVYYTVQKGDTLWDLAIYLNKLHKTDKYSVAYLVSLNPKLAKNPDLILAGEVIRVNGDPDPEPSTYASRPTVTRFGLISNTDNELYAQWTWDLYTDKTDGYQYVWQYDTGNNIWFNGNGDEGATTKSK